MAEAVNKLTGTSEQVRLISADDLHFIVNKDVVAVSKHLQECLGGDFQEGTTQEIKLNITAEILEVCIKYMHYKVIFQSLPVSARPDFTIAPPIAHNVLKAAIYLRC